MKIDLESDLPRFHTLQRLSGEADAGLFWEFDTFDSSRGPVTH